MPWKGAVPPQALEDLYTWVDRVPLSKPKRKIERDFADGTLVAEIVRYYLPDLVDSHNYISNSSSTQKRSNWETLNRKVFARLDLVVPESTIDDVCNAKQGAVEIVLFNLRAKVNGEIEQRKKRIPRLPLPSSSTMDSIGDGSSFLSKTTNRSMDQRPSQTFTRLQYEELKQKCLVQQEEIQVLQVKMRRLEHIAQLKDVRITELSATIKDCPHMKAAAAATATATTTVPSKPKRK